MKIFTLDFIIQELLEFLPVDIYTLLNSSKMYQTLYKERLSLRYWSFNDKYSHLYLSDENESKKKQKPSWLSYLRFPKKITVNQTFNEYINSIMDTQNQLSINFKYKIHIINDTNVKNLAKVHSLNLSGCYRLTNEGIKHLAKIHTLDLHNCNITDDCVKYLENVHTLNLSGCRKIIKGSEHLGKVHTLNLSGCSIVDEGIKHLGNVHTLNLSKCNIITDEGIKHLGNVHTLNLSKCNIITDEGIKHLGKVHTLDLTSCSKVSDEGIKHLGKVHTLFCDNITNKGIDSLGNCHTLILKDSNIKDISILRNVDTLTLVNLTNVPKGIKNLHNKKLSISVNKKINLGNVEDLANKTAEYYELNLSGSSSLLNFSLKDLGNVYSLDLSFCCKLSDEGLQYLGNCHLLNLNGCYDITDKGLGHLRNVKKIFLDVSFPKNITNQCLIDLGNVYVVKEDNDKLWRPYKRNGGNILMKKTPS